jgi:hypothetical protein
MVDATKAELAKAKAHGDQIAKGGVATGVAYDEARNRVVVTLSTGIEIGFDPKHAQGLENPTAEDLRAVEVEGAGFSIYFPRLDADIYIPALLQGITGRSGG